MYYLHSLKSMSTNQYYIKVKMFDTYYNMFMYVVVIVSSIFLFAVFYL